MRLSKAKSILLTTVLVIFGVTTSLFWYFQKPFSDMMISVAAKSYEVEGRISYKASDFKNALKCFDKVVQVNPLDGAALVDRGTAHTALKNYQEAIADYTKAIQLDSTNPTAYRYRAHAYIESGQREKALSDYETLIRLKPAEAEETNADAKAAKRFGYHFDESGHHGQKHP